jgi:hypothetical protein
MDTPHDKYRRQIAEAWSDLIGWEKVQGVIEQRVADLRELVRATANFLPSVERDNELLLLDVLKHPSNITEAVRSVLFVAAATGTRLAPTDIKQRAEQRGFSFAEYTNPLASIHTILRRMKESDPPEVDYEEADGTYLFRGKVGDMSPKFLEKTKREIWKRMIARGLDAEKLQTLLEQVAHEVTDEAIDNAKKRLHE